ncbi:MAG: hypothetical protein AAF458_03030 [Pseudomonadota bacterium]
MSDQDFISLDALSQVLRRHLGQGDTGTLFIKTAENHWGCFGLRNGLIVSVMCRGVKDAKAMQHIQVTSAVTVRFDGSQVTGETPGGPALSNDQIFAGLAGLPVDAPVAGMAAAPAAAPAPAPTAPVAAGPSPADARRIIDILKAEAADALGPIGPLICEDLVAGRSMTPEDIQQILGQLARDIGDADAARTFQVRVLERIRGG